MKAQCLLSSDVISSLPADVIETILCLLPIKEAARTSILSHGWRYKWTKIPKLVFNELDFRVSTNKKQRSVLKKSVPISSQSVNMRKKRRLLYAIYQVLLLHQGPISEFSLTTSTSNDGSCVEIDQIILHLLRRNTVKKLYLNCSYMLPLSVFSFHKLTDLYLSNCYIQHQPTIFNGFGSLTTLHLEPANISYKTLLRLLSNCPLLKSFTLKAHHHSISLDADSTLIQLFEYLCMIEDLTIGFWGIQCFGQIPHIRELPTSLLNLKYIRLQALYVNEKDGYGLSFLVPLIRSSPNLKKIKLLMNRPGCCHNLKTSFAMMDYSDIKLEHLMELEIIYFFNLKPDLEFVKIILAKSSVLRKVRIRLYEKVADDEELKMSRLLSSFSCASTGVKINLENGV